MESGKLERRFMLWLMAVAAQLILPWRDVSPVLQRFLFFKSSEKLRFNLKYYKFISIDYCRNENILKLYFVDTQVC